MRVQRTRRQGTSRCRKPYRSRNTVVPWLGGLQIRNQSDESTPHLVMRGFDASHKGRKEKRTKLEDRGTMECQGERATIWRKVKVSKPRHKGTRNQIQKTEATRKMEKKTKQATTQQSRVRNMGQVRIYAGAGPGIYPQGKRRGRLKEGLGTQGKTRKQKTIRKSGSTLQRKQKKGVYNVRTKSWQQRGANGL